jgi:hypothetical protein
LTKKGFLPDIMTNSDIPKEVPEFIKSILPSFLTKGNDVTDRGRLMKNVEYTTPDHILKNNPLFDSFRSI